MKVVRAIAMSCGAVLLAGADLTYYDDLPSTMNPLLARSSRDQRTHELVFDRLVTRGSDGWRSRLLVSDDHGPRTTIEGAAITVSLVPGVRWHDGESLGPDDECFTIAALRDPANPAEAAGPFREALAGCEVVGDSSVRITLARPVADPLVYLQFPVLPAHAFAGTAMARDDAFATTSPIGTGPMRAVRGRRDVRFTAWPNPHHAPSIATMTLLDSADPFVQLRHLENGTVHGVVDVPRVLLADAAALDDVVLHRYDTRTWTYVALNTSRGPLSDRRVRQALDQWLDRRTFLGAHLDERPGADPLWEPMSGPFLPSSRYVDPDVHVRPRDPDAAAARMREAGGTLVDGKWHWNGAPIVLRAGLSGEAMAFASWEEFHFLRDAGFEVELYKLAGAARETLATMDLIALRASAALTENVGPLFHTPVDGLGAHNLFGYSDPRVDALLDAHDAATTDAAAIAAYRELHAVLAEELPCLFVGKIDAVSAWRREVADHTIAPSF